MAINEISEQNFCERIIWRLQIQWTKTLLLSYLCHIIFAAFSPPEYIFNKASIITLEDHVTKDW